MNTSALVVMLGSMGIFTVFCAYFFYLVLITPPKPEPDSFEDNNAKPRV